MKQIYFNPSAKKVELEELKNGHSNQIIASIRSFGGTISLIDSFQDSEGDEYLVLNVLPNIPNSPSIDIRQTEEVIIITSRNNQELPRVFATRDDFPVGLPHTNITKEQHPVSLCIFEDRFEELKYQWSGSYFLQSIKNWLQLTARNELHQEDQPLEPFFVGSNGIIINPDHIYVRKLPSGYYTTTESPIGTTTHRLSITTKPIENGVVNQSVENLHSLNQLFSEKKIDLLTLAKPKVDELVNHGISNEYSGDFWKGQIFLIVEIPILREDKSEESTIAGFKINVTLGEFSTILGDVILNPQSIIKIEPDHSKERLSSIGVEVLNPHPSLSISSAKLYSGSELKESDSTYSLIGLGALGSQFFMNLARSGFGKWNLIDNDILLPHNFIRHSSTNIEDHITKNKAEAMAKQANLLLGDKHFAKSISKNIYEVKKSEIEKSDAIIDMSTSIGVERYIANEFSGVRKFSLFLNPMGSDLVMLSEDTVGDYRLDILEIQYYKELLNNSGLSDHLSFEQEGKIRYARGCRDVTSKIPQENLSIFSGIAAKAFKSKLNRMNASINIWRLNSNYGINNYNFQIDSWIKETIDGWTIFFNEKVKDQISSFRLNKLPNETGGVLIGAVDTFYKKLYVTNTILSPEDSIEKPSLFIRGINDVQKKLEVFSKVTNNNLKYLGEWHSHPKNCELGMSRDDEIQFAELLNEAKINGQPALMCIFGDDNRHKTYFDNCEI